jgi:hypothetical protein
MYIRYRTKETQARADVNRIAYCGDDNRLLVLSAHGAQQSLRGLGAVLATDSKTLIEYYAEEDAYSGRRMIRDGSGYRCYKHLLYPGVWQFLWVSKDPQLLVAGKEALGQALMSDRFSTPLLPEWEPYLRKELEAKGLLIVLKGDGCPSALLKAASSDLDGLVTQGIEGGVLQVA